MPKSPRSISLPKKEWGPLTGRWVEPDLRDTVVALIRRYSLKTGIPIKQLLGWLGLREGKFYEWSGRIFHPNRHNGKTPRKHWITDDEKEKILAYQAQHPEEGYRVLTYMMMRSLQVVLHPLIGCFQWLGAFKNGAPKVPKKEPALTSQRNRTSTGTSTFLV